MLDDADEVLLQRTKLCDIVLKACRCMLLATIESRTGTDTGFEEGWLVARGGSALTGSYRSSLGLALRLRRFLKQSERHQAWET